MVKVDEAKSFVKSFCGDTSNKKKNPFPTGRTENNYHKQNPAVLKESGPCLPGRLYRGDTAISLLFFCFVFFRKYTHTHTHIEGTIRTNMRFGWV